MINNWFLLILFFSSIMYLQNLVTVIVGNRGLMEYKNKEYKNNEYKSDNDPIEYRNNDPIEYKSNDDAISYKSNDDAIEYKSNDDPISYTSYLSSFFKEKEKQKEKNVKLNDIIHHFLDKVQHSFPWNLFNNICPDQLITFEMIWTIACIFLFTHNNNNNNNNQAIKVWKRLLFLTSLLYILRGFLLLTTVLPDVSIRCSNYTYKTDIWNQAWKLFFFTTEFSCYDLIVSGHTISFILMTLVAKQYYSYKIIRIITYLLSFIGIIAILFHRLHYTIDVLLGIIFTWQIWTFYHTYYIDLNQKKHSFIVTWLEQEDF